MLEHTLISIIKTTRIYLDNVNTERFFRKLASERVNYRRNQKRHHVIADALDYIEPFDVAQKILGFHYFFIDKRLNIRGILGH